MTYEPENFLVWGELPVTDMTRAIAFYQAVTEANLTVDNNGPNPMAVFLPKNPKQGVALNLYPGTPAPKGSGPTLHLSAPRSLENTMQRVRDAGGEVVSEPISLPAGRFFYALDLDGNSVGFFEHKK
ncbi:VOC family protein [Pelagimonas varians]|uniref:Glyoxalase-like domain protein n=1 Tax=Pelagimonas varians TaxID=696760 RepID=A0A238JUH4_9RHOB|nr:VOC family protein [Pelagimonas varians]PYG34385.1 hypothetical protein C8N36_10135 [Pelagimonas varians]SMX34225.1 Glyoxalase-like domain protein [Pelagimonas varians]